LAAISQNPVQIPDQVTSYQLSPDFPDVSGIS
jgi:hypothetical protein